MSLGAVPDPPEADEAINGYWVLAHAWWTAESFLASFDDRTRARGRGAPSDQDYDLMRAMLVFSCSGLDSMIKHLIVEALPILIYDEAEGGAKFAKFVKGELAKEKGDDFLADILTSREPKRRLVNKLIESLTSGSLQSKAEILRAGSYFGLTQNALMPSPAIYDSLFDVSNQIVHEMDMDLNPAMRKRTVKQQNPKRSRTTRRKDDMVKYSRAVLTCGARFLAGVDRRLADSS